MKKLIKQLIKQEKCQVSLITVFFLLQIFPILILGQYNHPTSDDFLYGKASHDAWLQTGSLVQTIGAALRGVQSDYQTWQGSFSALFMMRLEPTVFGEKCYALVPFLMIGLLTLGTLYFSRTIFLKVFESNSLHFITVGLVIVMLSIQFSPVASEQFFWYNSAVYYNAFHAFMLCYLAWMCRFVYTERICYIIYMAIFGVVLGGGNYVTALTLAIIMFCTIAVVIFRKKIHWARKAVVLGILWLEFLACFVISARAPGNAVRGETILGFSPLKSVIESLLQGTRYYAAWLDKWWFMGAFLLLPIFVMLVRKVDFSFSYPVLVLLFSYGVFSAMSCPTYYALGSTGPGRIINIIYDAFLILTYGQLCYCVGYVVKRFSSGDTAGILSGAVTDSLAEATNETMSEIATDMKPCAMPGAATDMKPSAMPEAATDMKSGAVAEIATDIDFSTGRNSITFPGKILLTVAVLWAAILLLSGSFMDTTTITACKVWLKGEAKQYDAEYQQRLAVLNDPAVTDVEFDPYTVEPALVFIADGTEDPEFVNNREWADFYGKNSLIIRTLGE